MDKKMLINPIKRLRTDVVRRMDGGKSNNTRKASNKLLLSNN